MSVHHHIARFLQENGYHKTLLAFRDEHGSELDTGVSFSGSLEDSIVSGVKDLSITDSAAVAAMDSPWMKDKPTLPKWKHRTCAQANVLPSIDGLTIDCALNSELAVFATATKKLCFVDLNTKTILATVTNAIQGSVVKKVVLTENFVVLAGINGQVKTAFFLKDARKLEFLDTLQAHERLIVDLRVVTYNGKTYMVSLGWDKYIKVHEITQEGRFKSVSTPCLISTPGNCLEAFIYREIIVIAVGRQDSSLIDVFTFSDNILRLRGQVASMDAEFSTERFTPMCIKGCNVAESVPVIAIATSQEPYMRVVLLSLQEVLSSDDETIHRHLILANFNTFSPQDKYSEAKLSWVSDGSGLWIYGDDGSISGLELDTGKVTEKFKNHDGRIKCFASLGNHLLTCGIDRKSIFWNSSS
ncbi:hypothetical protein PUMCH_004138 [Australozyma saopauloensis]|uniref:LisH domain-containing protein n=1 Tax=Australozyma saopauloensis TaxID=291208 RepID=A0AAX4HDT2_9ASCO|nr:hypothetical protein PUMCH_004138 [[Candida] saopauloensis]